MRKRQPKKMLFEVMGFGRVIEIEAVVNLDQTLSIPSDEVHAFHNNCYFHNGAWMEMPDDSKAPITVMWVPVSCSTDKVDINRWIRIDTSFEPAVAAVVTGKPTKKDGPPKVKATYYVVAQLVENAIYRCGLEAKHKQEKTPPNESLWNYVSVLQNPAMFGCHIFTHMELIPGSPTFMEVTFLDYSKLYLTPEGPTLTKPVGWVSPKALAAGFQPRDLVHMEVASSDSHSF